MQNCPLETAQIASVMALNAQNRKIYGALPRALLLIFWTLSCKSAYPGDEFLCHYTRSLSQKQPLLKVLE